MRDPVLQPQLGPAGVPPWRSGGLRVLRDCSNTTAWLPGQSLDLPSQVRSLTEVADDDDSVDEEDGEDDVLDIGLCHLV